MEGVHLVHIEMRELGSAARPQLDTSKASTVSTKRALRAEQRGEEEDVKVRTLTPNILRVSWSRGAAAAQDRSPPMASPGHSPGQTVRRSTWRRKEEEERDEAPYWKSSLFEYRDVRKSNTLLMQKLFDNRQQHLEDSRKRGEVFPDIKTDSFSIAQGSADQRLGSSFLSVSFESPAEGQSKELSPMSETMSR